MTDETVPQLDHGWVAINKPGIWRFDGSTATFVADGITDEMVDRAYTSFFGLEDQRRTPESRLLRVRAALEGALYGTD